MSDMKLKLTAAKDVLREIKNRLGSVFQNSK
jgi:hypothetical protein